MRFSYWANAQQPWADILASARHAEATGWDGVYVADHFVPSVVDPGGPTLECWSMLAGLAAAVPRVRLGALVTGNTYRNPALLAKIATTTDHISGGRVVLGLGAGWQENEHTFYGFEYGTVRSRLDRLEEACTVISGLLRDERTTFHGEHYRIEDAPLSPKAVQDRLPLLIGGGGEQRTLRIAARYADEWNIWGSPERLAAKGAVLEERCNEIGRDPAEIHRSAQALVFVSEDTAWLERFRGVELERPTIVGTPEEVVDLVAAYRDAGVDELIVPDFTMPEPTVRHRVLDLLIERVAPAFR